MMEQFQMFKINIHFTMQQQKVAWTILHYAFFSPTSQSYYYCHHYLFYVTSLFPGLLFSWHPNTSSPVTTIIIIITISLFCNRQQIWSLKLDYYRHFKYIFKESLSLFTFNFPNPLSASKCFIIIIFIQSLTEPCKCQLQNLCWYDTGFNEW